MKKTFLYSMLIAASALTSCSSEDVVNTGGQSENAAPANYISVNVVSTPETGTRATGDNYEDGTDAENTVKKVRFYFFDASGNAVVVKSDQEVNYYDWDATAADGTETTGPVEKKLAAVLLIEPKKGDQLPAQIVAVVNPEDKLGNNKSINLDELRNLTSNYAEKANEANNASFVMFNSVYANAANTEEISATKLTVDNFQKDEAAAKANPVNIYVERNVAKVKVAFDNNLLNANNRIQAKDKDGNAIQVGGKDIYIEFAKWNISGDLNLANLSKHIVPAWDNTVAFDNWNDFPYFRSYWASAVNTGSATVENQYANYTNNAAVEFTDGKNFKYCNENALKGDGIKNTQVIIPAKLVDADGNAYTIAEFAGQRYMATAHSQDESDLTDLKNAILSFFENDHKHYYKDGNDYKEIGVDDITFKTARVINNNTPVASGSYYVYPCLSTTGSAKEWYNGSYTKVTDVDTELQAMPHAKIWKNGATYFFFDINHINDKPGVVRNHLYSASLTAIYGLGTPVYDPEEVIIPEKPGEDGAYIAAQVKILSWRVVSNSPTLDWGK